MKNTNGKYRTSALGYEILDIFKNYEVVDVFIDHNPRDRGYTWLVRNKYDESFHTIQEDRNGDWIRKQCIQRWGMPPRSRVCRFSGDYIPLIKGVFTDIKIEKNGNNIWRSLPHLHIKRGVTEWKIQVGTRPKCSLLVFLDLARYWECHGVDSVDFTNPLWDSMYGMKITDFIVVDKSGGVLVTCYVIGDHCHMEKSGTLSSPKALFTYEMRTDIQVDTLKLSKHPLWEHFNLVGAEEVTKW